MRAFESERSALDIFDIGIKITPCISHPGGSMGATVAPRQVAPPSELLDGRFDQIAKIEGTSTTS